MEPASTRSKCCSRARSADSAGLGKVSCVCAVYSHNACCAALAGCGRGKDGETLGAQERAHWRKQSRKWLQDQKAKLLRIDPPAAVAGVLGLEHFALEAEMGGQKFLMDYHVLRQANGGATLAARLLPAEQDSARKEVERIARSLVVTRKQ